LPDRSPPDPSLPAPLREALRAAAAHHAAGRYRDAVIALGAVLPDFPASFDLRNNLGVCLRAAGDIAAATELFARLVADFPDRAEGHYNRGNAESAAGRHEAAIESFRRVLALAPRHAGALNNMGLSLNALRRHEEAAQAYARSLAIDPANADCWTSLGAASSEARRFALAIACHRRALAIRPDHQVARANLVSALFEAGAFDQALALGDRFLAGTPAPGAEAARGVRAVMGQALISKGEIGRGLAMLEAVLAEAPEHLSAALGRARGLLLAGDLAAGWAAYAARFRRPGAPRIHTPAPAWDGRFAPGLRLLIWAEQGAGDIIQMLRYLPLLLARGVRPVLRLPAGLRALAESVVGIAPGDLAFVAEDAATPRFDAHTPMLDLPRHFATTIDTIPATTPYLRAPDLAERARALALAPELRAAITPAPGIRRVGIVWAGNPRHENDRNRSAPLERFLPLLALPGLRLVSLQKGAGSEQLAALGAGALIPDLGAALHDYADTAAILAAIDLVVSVDTSIVHLAGALGRPVWTLVPHAPDWRWLLDRADTPWYPSMRLFRQPRPGAWGELFAAVAQALAAGRPS